MTTYTWEIISKQTLPFVKDYIDVVVAVTWKLIAELEDNRVETLSTSFFHSPFEGFIPNEELTDDILISWITNKENMDGIYAELESRLNK